MRRICTILSLPLVMCLLACKSDDEDPFVIRDVAVVTGVIVEDISNFGNGSDIRVSFNKLTDEADLVEYRIYLTKSSGSTSFNSDAALTIPSANYYAIDKTGSDLEFNLPADMNDTDGAVMSIGNSYNLYVLALVDESSTMFMSGLSNATRVALEEVNLVVVGIKVFDVANAGDASDISISFNKLSDESLISQYRIYITKATSSFELETAFQVDLPNYIPVDKTGSNLMSDLSSNQTDVDGDEIVVGTSYNIYVSTLIESKDTPFASGLSSAVSIELSQTNLVSTISEGFSASGGVLVGPDDAIYVADFGTGTQNGTTLLKFSADASSFSVFATGLLGPTGGAFDSQGNLYWSSYSNGKIHKIDANGAVTDFVTVSGPVAIVVDDQDDLFVAGCDSNEILKITSDGTVTTFATNSAFNCPNGLVSDGQGNLYACNFEDGKIFKISSDGVVSDFVTIPSGSSVNMVFKNDYLYVTGRNAHKIYKISTTSQSVETLAGTGDRGSMDGAALDSEFSFPNGIAFSNDGKVIFVNDVDPGSGTSYNPNTLRKIELVE